jgi:competence protein ComEC
MSAAPILIGILGYTLLTGVRPSAVRAGLMVGMATMAGVAGRAPDSLTGLMVAAVLMAGFEPRVLLDIGFQLSFTATAGLILLWPRMRRVVHGVPAWLAEPAGITLAVTIATLPVMLSVFQSVSLISPLAHVVAMPMLPPVLLVGVLLIVSAPLPLVNQLVAWLGWLPTTALAETVRISGSAPGAALSTGQMPVGVAVAMSLALLAWGLLELPEASELRQAAQRLIKSRQPLMAPLAMATIGLLTLLMVRPDGHVHVQPLAVSPGEAVFVRGPDGQTVLIARGRIDGYALTSAVAERLRLWEHDIGAVIALDEDAESRLGPLLERYPSPLQHDERYELGGGAVIDIYAGGHAALSYADGWTRLIGQPPAPADADAVQLETGVR